MIAEVMNFLPEEDVEFLEGNSIKYELLVETMPDGTAKPNACVAWSTSPHLQPAPTRTVRDEGSTLT